MYGFIIQRTITRVTIGPGQPIPPEAPKTIRHLLDPRDGIKALCGYVPDPGDIVERPGGFGFYADATSDIHGECRKRSEEQAENQ